MLAPLAGGPTTAELAAAVTDAWRLGFLAAGYLNARCVCRAGRGSHERSPGDRSARTSSACTRSSVARGGDRRLRSRAGAGGGATRRRARRTALRRRRLRRKAGGGARRAVEVVSFTFGCPSPEEIAQLQDAGSEAWVTVDVGRGGGRGGGSWRGRARRAGPEAGGHRGAWRDDGTDQPLLELLAEVRDACDTTLVATGGIGDSGRRARGARCRRVGRAGGHRVPPLSGGRDERATSRDARAARRRPRSRARSPVAGRAGSSTSSCASIRTRRRRTRTSTT